MAIDITLDWDELRDDPAQTAPAQAMSASDALVRSMRSVGHVDMDLITQLSGLTEPEAVDALGSAIFFDPDQREWQTAGQYLTGDMHAKLECAKAACAEDASFQRNVDALQKAMPARIPAEDIYVTIGSPWVPEVVIEEFVHHILPTSLHVPIEVQHDPATGSWSIRNAWNMDKWVGAVSIWGTERMPAISLLEGTLNGRNIRVYDEIESPDSSSGTRRIINHDETIAALDKQQKMIEEFRHWIWTNPLRTLALETSFNERYCMYSSQRFDGSCLDFPGMSSAVELRPYQRDAVMRILLSTNVLLAHDVGAGKTYTCIAAGMELRRLDPNEKVLFVVPNNVLGQWAELFMDMYPSAFVRVISPSNFSKSRRQVVLADIRDGAYDAVIMAQSSFDLIPISKQFKFAELNRKVSELGRALNDPRRATSGVKRRRTALVKRREKLSEQDETYDGITFDELGVTRLFVDEAHNYKNLACDASAEVQGMSRAGSAKCDHMLEAVRCVNRAGGGVIFATGTVLTNSIADCYTFQQYLQPGRLASLELESFDAWAGMFAQRRTEWEIDVDTSAYRLATHFSGFGNLEALSAILGTVADFHHLRPGGDLPSCKGRTDVLVARSQAFAEYLESLSKRVDDVRAGKVQTKDDNLLKICSDGRKAALDIRLVDATELSGAAGKVRACADNVARIWSETSASRLTQLVFCDISTPGEGFNVYDELRTELVARGIPKREIAFVHDATTERARGGLFAAVRNGTIRVIIGSTPKLGLGVNIQDRLVAEHHLDVPWRPSDMVQREGRILREGNGNDEVHIYRYVTEGSFDAYSWQLLERKQRIIDELLSGTYGGGFLESDIGELALSYGEIKALAVGNPLIRERVETANELERLRILQRQRSASREAMHARVIQLRDQLAACEATLVACEQDAKVGKTYCNLSPVAGSYIMRTITSGDASFANKTIARHRGFDVVVPSDLDPAKPGVLLVRNGRWPVDLSRSDGQGVARYLDKVLDSLPAMYKQLLTRCMVLRGDLLQAQGEMSDGSSALKDQMDRLQARLTEIDLKLEEKSLEKGGK